VEKLPPLVSLVPKRYEDGGWGGVPRFDWELRKIFPEVISLNTSLLHRLKLRALANKEPRLIVIAGNETSLLIPDEVATIVVHHGCAQTHYDRDPTWRGREPSKLCQAQLEMYRRPNRWYAAAARWTAQQFTEHYAVPEARIIPNWVERISRQIQRRKRPVVLGDWRTFNKGSMIIDKLRQQLPHLELLELQVADNLNPGQMYSAADCYLCLSLSEGGAYAVSDAEAATLPLVTTDVGNYLEYRESQVLAWSGRDKLERVAQGLEAALATPRQSSFFAEWTQPVWRQAWVTLLTEVSDTGRCPPLINP